MPAWYGDAVFLFGLALFALSVLADQQTRRRERRINRMLQDISAERERIDSDRATVIGYLEDKHRESE